LRRVLDEHLAHITKQIRMLIRLRRELMRRRRNLPRSRPQDAGYCPCLQQAGQGSATRRLRTRRGGRAGRKARLA
jgi:hypothetical protein